MEKPSFKSSPWIRGAPHRVFSRDIRRTRWRISLDTGGRPGFLRRDFHVQKSLNPLRCQPMTVSGLTITRAWRQPGHRQDRMTQKTLSAFRSDGRGLFRFRTATCCRRARISVWSAARSAKISMILCMPERVSGGDAKFKGFCDRWNKWEGQAESVRVADALTSASEQQRTARSNDTIGVIFLGLPVSSLSGGNVASQIAALKGEQKTI